MALKVRKGRIRLDGTPTAMWNRQGLAVLACTTLLVAGGIVAYVAGREHRIKTLLTEAKAHAKRFTDERIFRGEGIHVGAMRRQQMGLGVLQELRAGLAELDQVLVLRPDHYEARLLRATIRLELGDYHGALADADQVCQEQPGIRLANDPSTARHLRAEARWLSGDLTAALADLDALIAEAPDDPGLALVRATILHDLGNPAAALTECARVESLGVLHDSRSRLGGSLLLLRGRVRRTLGDLRGATPDLEEAYARGNVAGRYWVALVERERGVPYMTTFMSSRVGLGAWGPWEDELSYLFMETTTEAQVFRMAQAEQEEGARGGRFCQAWFYIGMSKLHAGDRASAADHFHRSMETGRKDHLEYWEAARELKKLDAAAPPP